MELNRRVPVLFGLILILFAGCGSDDPESATPSGTTPAIPSGESYTTTPFAADYEIRLQSFAKYHAARCEQVEGPYDAAACLAYTGDEPVFPYFLPFFFPSSFCFRSL